MKLISWNVNGYRAVLKKGFNEFFKKSMPDILCIQEAKVSKDQVDIDTYGYNFYLNSAEKKDILEQQFGQEKNLSVLILQKSE